MWLLIYLPAVLLLIAALLFPWMGRDLVGSMNAHEFCLFLAFWWMVLATLGRTIAGIRTHASRRANQRGFEPIVNSSREEDQSNQSS